METQKLIQFKKELEKSKKELEKQLKKLQKVTDFGDDIDSLEEEADETEEFTNQLSIAQNFKEHLSDIDSAMIKINKGRYGICEKCGKEISLDLLKVIPESRLCQKCKSQSKNSK